MNVQILQHHIIFLYLLPNNTTKQFSPFSLQKYTRKKNHKRKQQGQASQHQRISALYQNAHFPPLLRGSYYIFLDTLYNTNKAHYHFFHLHRQEKITHDIGSPALSRHYYDALHVSSLSVVCIPDYSFFSCIIP